jgi:Icc-related predicted phosphoesterase
MQIPAVADKRHRALYNCLDPERWRDVELVISSGDLDREYLSYLVTVLPVPLLYVPGNHDGRFQDEPPEGCDSVDGRILTVKGLVIGGLRGSVWYNGEGFQYRESEMKRRVRRLLQNAARMGGMDIFVTHSPLYGIHGLEDPCHCRFRAFSSIVEEAKTRVFLHGHNHEVFSKWNEWVL